MEPLTIGKRFGLLKKAKERPQNSHPKIQRVANHLRNRKHFKKHCSPKLVSIGPIHHGDVNLRLGEEYKLMWAAKYIENSRRNQEDLHKRIEDNIEELKGLFAEDVLTGVPLYHLEGFRSLEEKLSWVLFVDGCALLHILEKANFNEPDQMNVKVDQLVLVMMDVLLLENQIPYLVLKLLWRDDKDESELIDTMRNFLKFHHWNAEKNNNSDQSKQNKGEEQQSTVVKVEFLELGFAHLLDLHRRIILPADSGPKSVRSAHKQPFSARSHSPARARTGRFWKYQMKQYAPPISTTKVSNHANEKKPNSDMITYRNIQELRAAGIRLKSSKAPRPRDVSFSHGWPEAQLTLPEIVVDDTTSVTFLNLIAYEMCPDFKNDYEICSFASFMDSLIDHPEDVKALRSAGILLNSLGSDEEVANLFNIISTDLVPDMLMYSHVRAEIDKHYKNKWKTWIALGFHTHFSNPWTIIAFFAALLALFLTFVQTWFAMHPPK